MSGDRRLRDGAAGEHVAAIVRSADRDGLNEAQATRLLAALGVAIGPDPGAGSPVETASDAAGAEGSPTVESIGSGSAAVSVGTNLAKRMSFLLLTASVGVGGYVAFSGMRAVERDPVVARSPDANVPKVRPSSIDLSTPPLADRREAGEPSLDVPSRRSPPPRRQDRPVASPDVANTLRAEVRMLERCRAEIAAGRAGEALHLLRAFARATPERALAREAEIVEVEALLAIGLRDEAEAKARRAIAEDPRSPYAKKLNSLLEAARRSDGLEPDDALSP